MTDVRIEREPAEPAEPVAWLHICVKPGRREVYATVDPDDNKWWPADQWTSHTVHPLYAAPPAPAAVPDDVGLMEYQGNSVSFIYAKMRAYRDAIDNTWTALRAAGVQPDGKTSVAEAIARLAAPAAVPLTDEQITKGVRKASVGHLAVTQATAFREGVRFAERAHGIGVKP